MSEPDATNLVAPGFAKSRGATIDDAPDEAERHEALAAFRKAGLA